MEEMERRREGGEMDGWGDGGMEVMEVMERWRAGRMVEGERVEGGDGGMEGWKDGRVEGWKGGEMEGWRDGRMEGWKDNINKQIKRGKRKEM